MKAFLAPMSNAAAKPIPLNAITVIGRDPDCQVLIPDRRCSRHHCHIVHTPDGWRLTDLSTNGTLVNDVKVAEHNLRDGDVLEIGDSQWRFTVEGEQHVAPRKAWIVPERAGYRCLQLGLSLILVGLVIFAPLDEIIPIWSATWNHLTRPIQRPEYPKPTVADRNAPSSQSPLATDDLQLATRHPQPATSDPRPSQALDLSQQSFDTLTRSVLDSLAAGDIAAAENAVAEFRSSPFYFRHLAAVQKIEGVIAEAKQPLERAERERRAEIEERWKSVEDHAKALIAAENFDEAGDVLRACDDPRAPALAAAIDKARQDHINQRMPERRDLFATLVLKLRPFLAKRDYAGASRMLDTLANDPAFKPHRPLIEREKQTLAEVAAAYREIVDAVQRLPQGTKVTIEQTHAPTLEGKFSGVNNDILWIDHTQGARISAIAMKCLVTLAKFQGPSAVANLYLYDADYAAASLAAVDLAVTDLAAVSDFFIRMDLFQKAFIDEEIRDCFARADKYVADGKPALADNLLKTFAERYAVPVMEGVALPDRSSLPEGIAIHDGRLPQLDAVAQKREEIQAKITVGNPQVGNIPFRRLKLLGEKGPTDEKLTLLKSLKVVGGKEILPYIIRALDDDAARVRLEAVRTLIAVGDGANTWDLAKMADDPVPEIAQTALEGLDKIGARPDIIREKFATGGAEEKRLAVKVSGALGEEKLGTMVREGLGHGDWRVRKEAAIAVAKLKAKNAGNALVNALKTERFDAVEAAIAYALGAIKHTGGVTPLADLLKRKTNHPFKREILRAVGAIGGSESTKVLLGYLRDMDPWNRYEAVNGLAENHAKVNDDDLKHLLADDRWIVRGGAISAMIGGESDKSLDTIIRSLQDDHQSVRATAHDGLLYWKNAKVIPAIIKEMPGLGGEGLALAHDILKRLTGQSFATAAEWERWSRANGSTFQLLPPNERFKPRDGGKKQ